MRFDKRGSVFASILAALTVVFVIPGSAAGNIPSEERSVGFRGTLHSGAWVTYEEYEQEFSLMVADGRLQDEGEKKGDPGHIVSFTGLYWSQPCDFWNIAAAERFDTAFTGSIDMELDVVAEHRILSELTGEPEMCAWEETPLLHEHFQGSVNFDLVIEPARKCPKKGPGSGCNRSESRSGGFTVNLAADTPFNGEWTSDSFVQSWWGAHNYSGTYWWGEPVLSDPLN